MKKRRCKRKGKVPPQLRPYLFKRLTRKRKKTTMAKRTRRGTVRRKRRASPRASTRRVTRRKGKRRSGFGSTSLFPSKPEMRSAIISAAIGWAEGKSKADSSFMLNKLPRFIDQIGWLGNTGVALWLAGKLLKVPLATEVSRKMFDLTAYQIGRRGSPFGQSGEFFTVSGWSDDDVARVIDQYQQGALAADGGMPGVPVYEGVAEYSQFGEYGG